MTGYALETGSTGVDLEKRSQPKLTTSDASIYPKPDRIVSGPSPRIQFLDRRKAEAIVGYPAKAGKEREVARRLRSSSSRRKKSGASLRARGRRNVFENRGTYGLRANLWSVPKRQPKSAREPKACLPPLWRQHRSAGVTWSVVWRCRRRKDLVQDTQPES